MNDPANALGPRDPHATWWKEYQRLAAEHENHYLICGEDADETGERRYRRLGELEDLLRNTPATTFEGARVQLRALDLACGDGVEHDDLRGVLNNLNTFVNDIEGALERHQLKELVQRWCWEARRPSASLWVDHPGKPADAEQIWRAAHPPRGGNEKRRRRPRPVPATGDGAVG